MKRLLLQLVLIVQLYSTHAQIIKSGWAYGGSGNQRTYSCFTDKLNNRYQIITAKGSSFTIDSFGSPISVNINPLDPESITIVKFDSLGNYLYHLYVEDRSGLTLNTISLGFNSLNEVFLHYNFTTIDTVRLYNANGTLFKTIIPSYSRNITDGNTSDASSLLCKLNSNGQFLWTNCITWEHLLNTGSGITTGLLTINNLDQIYIPFFRTASKANELLPDTLSLVNQLGQVNKHFVHTGRIGLKFSSSGSLISIIEPFRSKRINSATDSIGNGQFTSITDGESHYSIYNFKVSTRDTLHFPTPVILNPGTNLVFVKSDITDSVIWARNIGTNATNDGLSYGATMDFDSIRKEIALGISYIPSNFFFAHTSAYNTGRSDADILLTKWSPSGSIIWEHNYSGGQQDWLNLICFNQKTHQCVLVGETFSDDLRFDNFIVANKNPIFEKKLFVIYFDSLNRVYALQTISSSSDAKLWRARLSYFPNLTCSYSSPIDTKGTLYISGEFGDTIQLQCNKLASTYEVDGFGSHISDGFVLAVAPILPIDTSICGRMKSPSGKYYWDSTGYYFDTIPDYLGCDSLIMFKIIQKQTNRKLDTLICDSITSYSGKYIWKATGTYFDTIPNSMGCDSIISVNLTILKSYNTIDSTVKMSMKSLSGKFVWDSTGIYHDTIPNSAGCDSILVIKLKVLQTYSKIDSSVCKQMKSPSGRYIYSSTGTYIDTIPNSQGADSIISIYLFLLQTTNTIDTSFCGTINSPSGKYNWDVTGSYKDTLINSRNCDSVLTINFKRTSLRDTIYVQNCDSFISPSGKYIYHFDGDYNDTIPSLKNCDSVLLIHYKRLRNNSSISPEVCDSFVSPSKRYVYKISGNYSDTMSNINGCDSIISIQLKVFPININVTKSNDISCENPTAILTASGNFSFTWSPSYNISNVSINNPTVNPDTTTKYIVVATNSIGCVAKDSIDVMVTKDRKMKILPNVFTPNNDGYNECISPSEVTEFKTFYFEVFDRWGAMVFYSNSINECWFGKSFTGKELSEGVYFYILKGESLCGQKVDLSGTITLIR